MYDHLELTPHQLKHLVSELDRRSELQWMRLALKAPLRVSTVRRSRHYDELTWLIHRLRPHFSPWLREWLSFYFTVIFQSSFEIPAFADWTGIEVWPDATLTIESTFPHHGLYDAKSTVVSGGSSHAQCYETIAASPDIFFRSYYAFDTMPSLVGQWIDFHNLRAVDWTNSIYAEIDRLGGQNYWAVVVRVGGVATVYTEATPSNPAINTLYCVEIHRDVTNQIAELWIEGSLKARATGLSMILNTDQAADGISGAGIDLSGFVDCALVADKYIGPETMMTMQGNMTFLRSPV